MKFFDKFKKPRKEGPNEFFSQLECKVMLDRASLQAMGEKELGELITKAQASYRQGLAADRAGEISVAREFYRHAFNLLPTHIEALDNYAIGLVEELNFVDATPIFEQSAVGEPSSPLAFVYLVKCYQEIGSDKDAKACAQYLSHNWPDKSPYLDWGHLGQPKEKRLLAPPLEEGQIWYYNTLEGDETSTIWIKLIELDTLGQPIVHISVADVLAPDDSLMFISHLPYDAKALLDCVTTQSNEKQRWNREDDHFGDGYGMWFEAYNAGEAGVFTAPINEIISGILKTIPNKQ